MTNPFAKKQGREYDSYDNYDSDFYRGDEEDGIVEDEQRDPEDRPAAALPPRRPEKKQESARLLKVVKPYKADEGRDIAAYLIKGYTVVMNIEELERPATVRLVDFLMGVLCVLDGEMRRVTKTTLVLSPRKGEMSGEDEDAAEDTEDELN